MKQIWFMNNPNKVFEIVLLKEFLVTTALSVYSLDHAADFSLEVSGCSELPSLPMNQSKTLICTKQLLGACAPAQWELILLEMNMTGWCRHVITFGALWTIYSCLLYCGLLISVTVRSLVCIPIYTLHMCVCVIWVSRVCHVCVSCVSCMCVSCVSCMCVICVCNVCVCVMCVALSAMCVHACFTYMCVRLYHVCVSCV